jgi:transcriptional regulator with AAA-type ATPase domain
MSDQEESSGTPDKFEFWDRLAEKLRPESWDAAYLRQVDEDIEKGPPGEGERKFDPDLLDGIRYLRNVHHLSADAIAQKLSGYGVKKKIVLKAYGIIQAHETEEQRSEVEKLLNEKPLIVPPGLNSIVLKFESHFAVSGDEPVMISGPTGVGKSLFLYLAKRLFQKQHENDEQVPPVVEANCGHFASKTSDLNMVRSELFGHVKEAYSGAIHDKAGLVQKADGGLLILEEVGELPFEAQAMLLTFIETGLYRRVGANESASARVKIVAATNRESDLRLDFRFRFFPYNLPALRERKGDILYYFQEIFPELAKRFSRGDVLLLLSHDWPGNVREIERVGKLLLRDAMTYGEDGKAGHSIISCLNPRDVSFDSMILGKLNREFEAWDVDLALVERLLNKHRVSLNDGADEPAFPELGEGDGYSTGFDEFALKYCEEYQPFKEAYEGYLRFCDLFLQNPAKDENVLSSLHDCLSPYDVPIRWEYPESYKQPIKRLSIAIMKYLKGVRKPDNQLPKNPYRAWKALEGVESEVDDNPKSSGLSANTLDEIAQLKEEDLLKRYYSKLLTSCAGNVRAAAARTGLEENTFRSRLYKLGIKKKKEG